MKDARIVFMGTPYFAVGVLKKLIEEEKRVVGVITAPDRPSGRGQKVTPSAVKEYALSQNIPVLQPTNLKSEEFLNKLKSLQADLQIVVAFRMLPKVVWSMPKYGTFNLHASLLPQYRGAAPINWAIINSEEKTGVTTFFIDEKIDTGAIILSEEIEIDPRETAETLHDKLLFLGSELVIDTVELIATGDVKTTPQPETGIIKEAPKLTTENTRINWNNSGEQIDAFIRGLSPYPVAWTILVDKGEELKVKIYEAKYRAETHSEESGHLSSSKKEMKIAVKDGYLYIKEIQLPGKRKMDVAALLNGYSFTKEAKMV
ncbi:methionyl-tRNA formyltransferase [Constantimarinum furrinae]|uniref:Methionyl-tRNA formyltransferase n=1 Tax=Constantimarinum furrinae TaxID=2562285 RepID=A0A7G8PW57_9FLAO|nr:methionyl-tRNA formyltransferase [Constantimarinum furrinae]QNJ98573.1 Methionyl-tRNA formyltransferase [Constantimarinum furrinae]